jgi:hypothetical protein
MSILIEKGISFTKSSCGKFSISEMEVLDSFFIPKEFVIEARRAVGYHGRRNGKIFSIKKYEDGYRCWRVE